MHDQSGGLGIGEGTGEEERCPRREMSKLDPSAAQRLVLLLQPYFVSFFKRKEDFKVLMLSNKLAFFQKIWTLKQNS